MAEAEPRSFNVGILCDGTIFQKWQAEAIRHLMALPGVRIAVLILDESARQRSHRWWDRTLYRKYRQHWFDPPAMRQEDLHELLKEVPRSHCVPEIVGKRQRIGQQDLARIAEYRPDMLLRFGFNILTGGILTLPRYGVWSFHHGDPAHYRGGPPGLWEIMDDMPVTGAILQRLTETLDGGAILRQGWFATIDHSLEQTVDTVLSYSAIWPAQVVRRILRGDHAAAIGHAAEATGKIHRYPGTFDLLRFFWKRSRNKIRFHRRQLGEHDQWNIGVLYQPIHTLLQEEASLNLRWLPEPSVNNFRADPFGYYDQEGELHVLYEKFDQRTGLGEIAKVRPRKDSVLKRSRTVLSSDRHFSYPYIVQRSGRTYVIPESFTSGKVCLYQMKDDHSELEFIKVLLEEPLVDPTVFEHEGRWWIFGTKYPLTNEALYAYHGTSFEGPYLPHDLNPIKIDIRSARPGGTPFTKDGVLYRPAQDSSITYGGRIAINKIIRLDPHFFEEETVKFVEPFKGQYDQGLHTVAAVGDVTLVDGKRFVTFAGHKAKVRKEKLNRLIGRNA